MVYWGDLAGEVERSDLADEAVGVPHRLARSRGGDAGQALAEDAPLAPRVVAEHAPDSEPDRDNVLAPRQVGQGVFVAAVRALGRPSARRAGYKNPAPACPLNRLARRT